MKRTDFNRREMLRFTAAASAAAAAFKPFAARAQTQPVADRLLFVVTATGGGSMVDSFMAVTETEAGAAAPGLIAYPDAYVTVDPGTGIRALDLPNTWRTYLGQTGRQYLQSSFVSVHRSHMAVLTVENTSVNHIVAQKRSVTGAGIHGGRTLMEAAAERYGQNLVLPNVNMAQGGYLEPGTAVDLPGFAQQEPVADARFFSLSTDGARGVAGAPGAQPGAAASPAQLARTRALMERARGIRNELDDASIFGQTFQCSRSRRDFLNRRVSSQQLESADLVTQLNLLGVLNAQLQQYGLATSPEADAARQLMESPSGSVFNDPFLAQACLAYLLARFGVSCAAAIGPSLTADIATLNVNPPLSFDYSHTNHVAAQATMWSRVLDVVDKLITLLANTPVGTGTMWDRSVIYLATDFGRDKQRLTSGAQLPGNTSTGHHLNNGAVILSPLIRPGLYGGITPTTLLTHGFNVTTGAAAPGTVMREGHLYSAVAQALDITAFPDFIAMPCLRVS